MPTRTSKKQSQDATPDMTPDMVKEAVGVFHNADDLQNAMDDLQINGFRREELSLLADEKTVEKNLGHKYKKIKEAMDDPAAPRTVLVPAETLGEAEGGAFGVPLYIAAVTAAGVTVASGGTLLGASIAAIAAGAAGAGIGTILAQMVARHHAHYLQEQIDLGGIILWVNLRSPDMRKKALDILKKHKADDVHVHEVPLYG